MDFFVCVFKKSIYIFNRELGIWLLVVGWVVVGRLGESINIWFLVWGLQFSIKININTSFFFCCCVCQRLNNTFFLPFGIQQKLQYIWDYKHELFESQTGVNSDENLSTNKHSDILHTTHKGTHGKSLAEKKENKTHMVGNTVPPKIHNINYMVRNYLVNIHRKYTQIHMKLILIN